MKFFIVAAALLVAVAARPQAPTEEVRIIREENENDGAGNFKWLSETSDGTRLEQSGYIKNPGAPQDETIQVIQGSYSYVDPDGNQVTVNYIADENGFQPTGDHLPTPPPVPEAIQRVIEIANRNAEAQRAAAAAAGR